LAAQVDSVDAALLRAEVIAQQAQLEALTAAADAAERREQASMAAVRTLTCRAIVEGNGPVLLACAANKRMQCSAQSNGRQCAYGIARERTIGEML
jgi:hypothetical protein